MLERSHSAVFKPHTFITRVLCLRLPHSKKVLSTVRHVPCAFSLWTLWLPPTLQKHVVSGARLIGHWKLALGVNGCLSLCVP